MFFGCPLLRALNKTGKMPFFQGRYQCKKFPVGPCLSIPCLSRVCAAVWCLLLSVYCQSGGKSSDPQPCWVPTAPGQGLDGFVGLGKRGLRHWPPWKMKQHSTRAGGSRHWSQVGFELYPSTSLPGRAIFHSCCSSLDASVLQCHLHPSTGITAPAFCFISVAEKGQRACSYINNSKWRTCCFLRTKCEPSSCPWVLCRFWYMCKTTALL